MSQSSGRADGVMFMQGGSTASMVERDCDMCVECKGVRYARLCGDSVLSLEHRANGRVYCLLQRKICVYESAHPKSAQRIHDCTHLIQVPTTPSPMRSEQVGVTPHRRSDCFSACPCTAEEPTRRLKRCAISNNCVVKAPSKVRA